MKRIYLIPNLITAFSLACGLFVIFKVSMIEPGFGDYEVILSSALLLVVAGIADFIDGALARAIRAESVFGFMFDSLADAVTFGVAPSVLFLKGLSLQQGNWLSFLAATGAMVYSLCGVLRLVRFSVAGMDENIKKESKKHFTGLPIPAAAAASVSASLIFLSPYIEPYVQFSKITRGVSLSIVMILLGYLMVCRLKFPSLKMLHFRVPSFHLAFITVVISIFVLYGVFHYFAIVMVLVSWSYIILGLILSLIRIIAGKKSKTLLDFEPEPDEFD